MTRRFNRSLAFAFIVLVPLAVNAHPGGLDSNGGHRDSTTGVYHYHRTANSAKSLVGGKIPGMGPKQGSTTTPAARTATPQRPSTSSQAAAIREAVERPNLIAMVDSVTDGDTIVVRSGSKKTTIRLQGIDAPELQQAGGKASREALLELVSGKIVQIFGRDKDDQDRTLGRVEVRGLDICLEQVRNGHAWKDNVEVIALASDTSHDEELKKAEAEAKTGKRGLWADAAPVAPWEFRAKSAPAKVAK